MTNQPDSNPITLFAQTNFRNQQRRFGIKLDDRRRHMYVLGKTGMGKTTLLENMILSDIYSGHGCAYIDPHGDTAERLIDFIPSWRINDVVYFNPADADYPMGFNILETLDEAQKHLVGSGLMGVFKKIWPDVWSPRMEYILLNCVLALLDYPGATLLGINRLLVDKEYRQRVIEKIRDPIVKTFWVAEFSSWSEKYATEAIAPVQNKVGQFLSASIIRNIVAQVKSTIVPRRIMDDQKIFIVNLSKGRIGEDNMRLLGGMLITKLQLAAMERVDMPEADRKDFLLYVDEFQNFAGPNFAGILSEARKYRLALILAHQYIEQLDETVRDAVFGNVGTILTFRVGSPDALYLEKEFSPTFIPEDLTNLPKYNIYLKLMVDGVATEPFSATALPPIANRTGSREKVIGVSRERYAEQRDVIEQKVLKWSGMEVGAQTSAEETMEPVPVPVVEPAGPVSVVEGIVPPPSVQYPSILTEEEREAAEASGAPEEGGGAGEYLRFSPERLAAIAKSAPAGKKEKPKFKHTCSRCGKVWEMPIQLDPTRPMFCSECLPLVREEKKLKGKVMKAAVAGGAPDGVELEEIQESPEEGGSASPSGLLEKAMRAVEDGEQIRLERHAKPPEPNRPRIVLTNPEAYSGVISESDDDEETSELLDAVAANRGAPVETRKRAALPPVSAPVAAPSPAPDRRPPPSFQPQALPPRRDDRRNEHHEHRDGGFDGDRDPRKRKRKPRERTGGPSEGFNGRPRIVIGDQDDASQSPPKISPEPRPLERRPNPNQGAPRPPSVPSRAEPLPARPAPPPAANRVSEDEEKEEGPIDDVPRIAFRAVPPPPSSQGNPPPVPPGRSVKPGERITF